LGAAMRLIPGFDEGWVHTPFFDNEPVSQLVSTVGFLGLVAYIWLNSNRRVEEA